ncbi:Alpha/Beta hydrolase protein [Armillaria luteobubalina]|uniref:Alpha/Beta hydrolase protein n=1 Tax=Armillaria luteobubalina TaxID=153913 RepID=A0AA39Q302_9AGAR|nr:Alpha/Beta hydrolase protein [Armillaria luteobubalina]
MSGIYKQALAIGGLEVKVLSKHEEADSKPAFVLFVLHGRYGHCEDQNVTSIVRGLLQEGDSNTQNKLYIVTFDHRNHGHRMVDPKANDGWSEDMYSIQTGTARDVSFLIDFLPAYMFPEQERTIANWGVTGVSLGGHSTWISLSQEPRLTIGIPIIGCPDYLTLMSARADKFGISLEKSSYLPDSLLALIQRSDPASTPYTSGNSSNPFLGKKILVLSGADDLLVPWSASEPFVNGLVVGENGVKHVFVQEGAGHKCTPEMVQQLVEFVRTHSN